MLFSRRWIDRCPRGRGIASAIALLTLLAAGQAAEPGIRLAGCPCLAPAADGGPIDSSMASPDMACECPSEDCLGPMTDCPAPAPTSTGGHSWCHGKCTFRRWDGVTRHCGRPAPKYPVPFATPKPTTPTLLWYPPLMPHNSLPHYRSAYSYRHAPGLSRTTVSWQPTYFLNALDKLHHAIELPR